MRHFEKIKALCLSSLMGEGVVLPDGVGSADAVGGREVLYGFSLCSLPSNSGVQCSFSSRVARAV